MKKSSVIAITDALGTDAICSQIPRVSYHAIRSARTKGVFPSSWYDVLDEMCREVGIPCPRSAFSFKKRSIGNAYGNAPAPRQGKGAA